MLDTKSYKELLDTYCFFSTSPEDDTNSSDILLSLTPPRSSLSTGSDKNEILKESSNIVESNGNNSPSVRDDSTPKKVNSNSNKERSNGNNNSLTVSSILKA